MVIRKPYAFIIKNFRRLHLIILVCTAFLFYTSRNLYNFFLSAQSSSMLTYAGAARYVNKIVYYVALVITVICLIIFLLFKKKKKPFIEYLGILIFSLIFCIVYAYSSIYLKKMVDNDLTMQNILLLKDLYLMVMVPQIIIMLLCFIRGVGFNLKQFNFSKDIKELAVSEEDSAEFEVQLGQNNYKYMRFIRRTLREARYFFLENKRAIIIIVSVGLLIGSLVGVKYYSDYLKKVDTSGIEIIGDLAYTVNKTYMTSYDYTGKRISTDYKYVVVNITFYNSTDQKVSVDTSIIKLKNNGHYYDVTFKQNSKFYDLGVPYDKNDVVLPNSQLEGLLVFEVPLTAKAGKCELKIQTSLDDTDNKVTTLYKTFDLNAINIDSESVENNYNFNEQLSVNVLEKNPFLFTAVSYSIEDNYNNKYVVCQTSGDCLKKSSLISTNSTSSNTMLEIDYRSKMYSDAYFTKQLSTYKLLFENVVTVEYTVYGKKYSSKASIVDHGDLSDKIFISVKRSIMNAQEIKLIFNLRNREDVIILKSSSTEAS